MNIDPGYGNTLRNIGWDEVVVVGLIVEVAEDGLLAFIISRSG
jgi:hypothetical protein